MATVMAILIGFTLAWILTRTNVPGREQLERLMELPYYMTPLVGALAWAVIAGPKSGFVNQLWHAVGGTGDIVDIYAHFGIAWVMALFEGTVAFVMISASMKSMDPALEESARVMGASKLRTTLTVTLPLVMPGVLGATLFVFAEMLGSFAAALVLGIPGPHLRHHHGDLGFDAVLSARLRPRLGDGAVAVRRDVRHADLLPLASSPAAASRPSPARRSGRGRWTWAGSPGCCSASAPSTSRSRWSCRSRRCC